MTNNEFILGEFRRTIDDRYRMSIPGELVDQFQGEADCILAKERPGCLSLWTKSNWGDRLDKDVKLIQSKIEAGRLEGRVAEVQQLGRLLSTRHREVTLAAKSRIAIPEGFREFLAVEPGGNILVVGAAVCIEMWHPDSWIEYLREQIPAFPKLMEELAG